VNRSIAVFIVAVLYVLAGQRPAAQSLSFAVFERYLESLREQAGIPGMSAIVLQGGVEVWSAGFGRADLDGAVAARPDTPYAIGGLSQTVGATLLLRACVEEQAASLNDPVAEWVPAFAEPTTLAQLLAHVAPATGAFQYDLTRFAVLTPVIEACAHRPYRQLVSEEVISRLGLAHTAPGAVQVAVTPGDIEMYGEAEALRHAEVRRRIATPYRLDRGRAAPSDVSDGRVDASTGLVTTVLDMARFDVALRAGALIDGATLVRAWTPPAAHLPAGLGWFVQTYNGQRVVWQFGAVEDAYSALYVKVPNRDLTFILFANSDTLAAPFVRGTWDVTASVFARLFLLIHLP
jgi:CubicO group peptidase (beta-lactamase class C family)